MKADTRKYVIKYLIVALVVCLPLNASATEKPPTSDNISGTGETETVQGEILIGFNDSTSISDIQSEVEDSNQTIRQIIDVSDSEKLAVVEVPSNQTVEEAVQQIQESSEIEYAQPNYIYHLMDETTVKRQNMNDPYVGAQWYLNKTSVDKAWNEVAEDSQQKVRVAVIDSGVQTEHPDLKSIVNKDLSVKITDTEISPLTGDLDGHGTHVSGIIAAQTNNNIGIAGVGNGRNNLVDLVAIDVFGKSETVSTSNIIKAIQYAMRNHAQVINMSLGAPASLQALDPALKMVCDSAVSQGVTLVCSAGNVTKDYPNRQQYTIPSDYPSTISVIASDEYNKTASFSYYGSYKDISAPGVNIISTYIGSGYGYMNGTSMAAPVVTGIVVLMLAENPDLSPEEIKDILCITATDTYTPGKDNMSGYGVINAFTAVKASSPMGFVFSPTANYKDKQFLARTDGITLQCKTAESSIYYRTYLNTSKKGDFIKYTGKIPIASYIQGQQFFLETYAEKNGKQSDITTFFYTIKGTHTGWIKQENSWYYYDSRGKRVTGWRQIGRTWYFMDSSTGVMYANKWLSDKFYLCPDGSMAVGWYQISGKWYYFKSGGEKATGWVKDGGKWYYLDPSSGVMYANRWLANKYYLYPDGSMATGWGLISKKWYYFENSGEKKNGWIFNGGQWYYLVNSTGEMLQKGWLFDTYYLKTGGAMATGWIRINKQWYYLNVSGKKIKNSWIGNYYLQSNGTMAVNKWIGKYYVGLDGKWIN